MNQYYNQMKNQLGIKDVAKTADVAVATVDRVMHGRSGVSRKTKEKVLKVISDLGYQPNLMASNLSRKKRFIFGVLLPKTSFRGTNYWDLPVSGIYQAQKDLEQYAISIETFRYDNEDENDIRMQVLKVINSSIDGLILASKFVNEIDILLQDCKEKKRPVIFIDSNIDKTDCLCSIHQPIYESAQLAAQLFSYCIKEGKILTLHLRAAMDTSRIASLKEQGVIDYLDQNKPLIKTEKLVLRDLSKKKLDEALKHTLTQQSSVKGIFVVNSKIAPVAEFLEKIGRKDLILIGYDLLEENHKWIEAGIIDFLICQKPERQGYIAIQKLFEHLVLKREVDPEILMQLDIVTKENYKHYSSFYE